MSENATSRLREEHERILEVADALEVLVRAANKGSWDLEAFADAVTFIRLFADACHHGKEEDLLFPELESGGMPRDHGPIAMMLEEHREARAFARRMAGALDGARAGEPEARAALCEAALDYVALIRDHIAKEDHGLFEMADHAVQGAACRTLCAAYEAVCARRFEGHTKEQLQALGSRIGERARLAAANRTP